MGCFLDYLRAFRINVGQWTTAAQVDGEWRRSEERGAEHFMPKGIAAYCRFLFWMKNALYVLLPNGVFYFVTTGWILTSGFMRIQSINQTKLDSIAPVVQLVTSKPLDVGTRNRISVKSHELRFSSYKKKKKKCPPSEEP